MARKKFKDEGVKFKEKAELSPKGGEILDTQRVFVAAPSGESQIDRIKRVVRQELSRRAHDVGFETFEESNDFDIDDPWDTYHTWDSLYERQAMVDEYPVAPGAQPEERVADQAPVSPDPPNEDSEHPDPE